MTLLLRAENPNETNKILQVYRSVMPLCSAYRIYRTLHIYLLSEWLSNSNFIAFPTSISKRQIVISWTHMKLPLSPSIEQLFHDFFLTTCSVWSAVHQGIIDFIWGDVRVFSAPGKEDWWVLREQCHVALNRHAAIMYSEHNYMPLSLI